jgi:hypothetical protein
MADPTVTLENSHVSVQPGGQAQVVVKISSNSTIVEGFDLTILGAEPDRWGEVLPPKVDIYPGEEATAVIVFTPPAGTAAPSGTFAFGLMARSTEDPNSSAVAEGQIELAQVFGLQAKIIPVTSSGRWRGRHVIQLSNWGNSPARLQMIAYDPDNALGFYLRPDVVDLPVGGSGLVRMSVRARKPFMRGQTVRVPFQVIGERVGVAPGPQPQTPYGDPSRPVVDGALNQKPIISKVFVTFLLVLLLAGVAGGAYAFTRPKKEQAGGLGGLGPPPKPKKFTAVGIAPDKIRLGWESISQISEYRVQVIDASDKTSVLSVIPGIDSSQTATIVTADGPDKETCFKLQAMRDKTPGPLSDLVCTKTKEAPPTPTPTPEPSATPTPSETPTPTPSDSTSDTPSAGDTATPSPTPTVAKGEWVVVANYWPVRTTDKALADERVRLLQDEGLNAQVLDSQFYPNFRLSPTRTLAERSWLVTAGPYPTPEAATADCEIVHRVPNTSRSCIVVQPDPP